MKRPPSSSIAAALLPLILVALTHGCSTVSRAPRGRSGERPRLVVVIAVDQLGEDLIERYGALFTGGFRRLADEGASFSQAWVDHGITVSHPGHVTLATGDSPARAWELDATSWPSRPIMPHRTSRSTAGAGESGRRVTEAEIQAVLEEVRAVTREPSASPEATAARAGRCCRDLAGERPPPRASLVRLLPLA